MALTINDTAARVQYTATAAQTTFTVPFEFFANADLKVYNGSTLLTYDATPADATEYSVAGAGVEGGGSITLGGGATAGDTITISRDIAIERSTDYPTSGAFDIDALNTELAKLHAMVAQVETGLEQRALRMSVDDQPSTLPAIPSKSDRASKALVFNADGEPAVQAITDDDSILTGRRVFKASEAGFSASMTAAEFDAAQAALVTSYLGAILDFDIDIAIDTSLAGVTKNANVDWISTAGKTLYPTASVAIFVKFTGSNVRAGKGLTIDGRSLCTSNVVRLDTNAVAKDLRGLTIAGEGRVTYNGVKADDDAALSAVGSSVASIDGVVGLETRDGVRGLVEGVDCYGVGIPIQINRTCSNFTVRHCRVWAYSTRGIAGRASSEGVSIRNITVEHNWIGQGLAGPGPRYPITFYHNGDAIVSNIKVLNNTLELGGRPYITGSESSNNGSADAINFHGVNGGVIMGNRIAGGGEAGITISQGCRRILCAYNDIDGTDTGCISVGPSGNANRDITVIGNRLRGTSIDFNNDHGAQPFMSVSNVVGFKYGDNTCYHPRVCNISNITQANPAVVTVVGVHDFTKGDHIDIAAVAGMTTVNGLTLTVLWATTSKIALADENGDAIDSSAYSAYTSGGTVSPVSDADYGIEIWDSTSSSGGKSLNVTNLGGNSMKAAHPSMKVTAISQANPAVATVEGTNSVSTGDFVCIRGSSVTDYNGFFKVTARTATTLTLGDRDGTAIDSTGYSAFTGTATVEWIDGTPAVPLYSTLDYDNGINMASDGGHVAMVGINSGGGSLFKKHPLVASTATVSTGVYDVTCKFPVKAAVACIEGATANRDISTDIQSRYVVRVNIVTSGNSPVDLPCTLWVTD